MSDNIVRQPFPGSGLCYQDLQKLFQVPGSDGNERGLTNYAEDAPILHCKIV